MQVVALASWHGNKICFTTKRLGIAVHQHPRFQVHPWNGAKKRRTKASQYFVTLDLIPSNARQKCVATALTICFYTQTAKFVRAQICVADMRVSRLQAKGRQHHLSENVGPAIAGSARHGPPALSERNEL